MIDLSSALGLAVGISSSHRAAVEKNTAEIVELRREMVRLHGGTVESTAPFHQLPPLPAPPTKPMTAVEIIGGSIVWALVVFMLIVANNDKLLRMFL